MPAKMISWKKSLKRIQFYDNLLRQIRKILRFPTATRTIE